MSKSSAQNESIDPVLEFLEGECDFQASCYERSYLKRRIRARLRRTEPEGYSGYRDLLADDETERDKLLDALSINVTKFFRNPEMWSTLRPYLHELADRNSSIRCWSAACADGREPYSLAMLANDDEYLTDTSFDIYATDIDQQAIESARDGTYQDLRTDDIESQLDVLTSFEPYMEYDGERYSIRPEIISEVTFRQHDLVRGEPFGTFDLVMCRNLLIYIESDAKREILETLVESIAPGGYLVIGMSESIPRGMVDGIEAADRSKRIYRRC